jgi:hypothetical protein
MKNNGIGIFGTTQIVLIILKVTENIDWSWPLTLSPLITMMALSIIGIIAYIIMFSILLSKGWTAEEISDMFGIKNKRGDGI